MIGISVHLADTPSLLPPQLALIEQSGANSIRDDVHWSRVESAKGQLAIPPAMEKLVESALKANLQPLLILDYGNGFYDSGKKPVSPEALSAFARYAVFVVQHFKGRVHMYEMWNEWDDTAGGTLGGTPQDYVRFLKAVYPAAKAADRSAIFLAGSISAGGLDWLSALLSAGALGFFDALSTHPYNFSKHARTPEGWAADMLATEAVIHRYTSGRDLPLYISEMGWPTYSGAGGSSPQQAAAFLAQMFLLARTMSFLRGIWWYDFRDDGPVISVAGDNFGLVDPSLKPKPAFMALKVVGPVVREASTVADLPTGNPLLHVIRFGFNGKHEVLAMWNASEAGVILVRVRGSSPWRMQSTEADSPEVHPMESDASVEVSNFPVLITGENLAVVRPQQ